MAKRAAAIQNAEGVIEAFGGIRPMAKKMDVAVTTVQGWKKRNAIPAARLSDVLAAARMHDVDLDGVLDDGAVANENVDDAGLSAVVVEAVDEDESVVDVDVDEDEAAIELVERVEVLEEDGGEAVVEGESESERSAADVAALQRQIAAMERKAASRSVGLWGFAGIVVLAVCGVFAFVLLAPSQEGSQAELERLRALEAELSVVQSEVKEVKDGQGVLGGLIPKTLGDLGDLGNLSEKIEGLKVKAEQAQEKISDVAERAQVISDDVLAEDAGGLEQRLGRLETHLQDITGSPVLAGLLTKFEGLQGELGGQAQLQESFAAIEAAIAGFDFNGVGLDGIGLDGGGAASVAPEDINAALDAARVENPALGQVFAGVPQQELKAAALLLGMTQFRSTLNRGGEAFDMDLAVLMKLVGQDDPELSAALEKLAPHAQSGVLSPAGLSDAFRSLAGEAVVASLQGEDVSIKERAQSRFNDLFQVEKGGELVSGTPTQAALVKTENLLQSGDLAAAIAQAQSLQAVDGDAAAVIAPWLDQAQATLSAQEVEGALTRSINVRAYGASAVSADGLSGVGIPGVGSRLVRDPESGLNVYVPPKGVAKGMGGAFKSGNTETINPLENPLGDSLP